MSVPSMVENILSNLTFLPESQLNIMHATYLVMESFYNLSSERGCQVFTDLYSKQGAKVLLIPSNIFFILLSYTFITIYSAYVCVKS